MIRQLYTLIGKAYENKNYKGVIELVDKALEIPEFGFNMNLIYKYGYSLLKAHRISEGMQILKFIVSDETDPLMLEKTISTIRLWKKRSDYVSTINDLYQRYCIFGAINDIPKNHFVEVQEKLLKISVGDVIAVYDSISRMRCYYYILDIDKENSVYRVNRIGHMNGELYIKDKNVEEIPFAAYIMEKTIISLENQRRLNEAMSSAFDNSKKR